MIPRFSVRAGAAFVVVAGVLFVSCEKVPLLAPSGSTITLSSSTSVVPVNGSTTIIAQVIEPAGTPPHSGTQVTFTTSLGSIQPADASTDSSGRAVVTFLAGVNNGTAMITAISGGSSVGTNGALKILVGTAAVGGIRLSANPTLVPATGGTSTITANVVDVNGNTLPGAPISFGTTAGTLSSTLATTDSTGTAQVSLRTTTKATVTATVGAQGSTQAPTGGGGTGGTTPTPTTPTASGPTTAQVVVDIASAPTVVITPPTSPPSAGLPAAFIIAVTAATSNGSAVRDVTINWGDGSSEDLGAITGNAVVSHVYARAGTYNITVTLTDTAGNTVPVSTSVTVIPVPRPTIIVSQQPTPGHAGSPTNVNIQITFPTGITAQDTTIDFGDGQTSDLGGATSASVPHVYAAVGNYSVKVTVLDTSGQITIGTGIVSIAP